MSTTYRYHEYQRAIAEKPRSGRLRRSTRHDADLTDLVIPESARGGRHPVLAFEDRAQNTRHQGIDNRYSNIDLPEVVTPEPSSSGGQGSNQTLEEVHRLQSSKSDRYFVREAPDAEGRTGIEAQSTTSSPATTLYTLSHLIFFSILGTLARLGLEAITFYPSTPVTSPVLWANLGGSFILGFLTEDRRIFREEWGMFSFPEEWSFHPTAIESNDTDMIENAYRNHGKVKKTIPLFIGLATGFCGCFTSFSSFIRDAYLALSNTLPSPSPGPSTIPSRNGGYSFEGLLAIIIIHITVSISALKFGAHLALALDPIMPTVPFKGIRTILDPFIVCLGLGSWTAAVFLSIFPPHQSWRGKVTFALALAPLGCLSRFYVSKYLNSRIPSFPLGTFAVNIFGTIILGICFDLQHSVTVAGKLTGCQVLEGVMEGFCGCTTTVSTWVAELTGLRRKHGYFYGLTSVLVALLFLIVIMGTLQWSRGFQGPVCA
jgi:fluoride exporter